VSWTLSYRLPSGASLDVKVGETTTRLSAESESAKLSSAEPGSAGWISSRRFTARAEDRFAVFHVAGDPQIFGAFVEYEKPGVVLDTVGINGARVETTLAWEPDQFVAQVRERSPDLVVIAFGTNEIFDRTNPARYQGQTEELMTRIRKAVPDVACWIVGPPDAARPEGGSRERVVEVTEAQRRAAEASACAFSSQFELMGGEGSFSRWMKERPAKARSDRIHFTISGYEQLGRSLSQQLVPTPDDEVPVAAEQ
jgi:lysophospholipase L1-like esterase